MKLIWIIVAIAAATFALVLSSLTDSPPLVFGWFFFLRRNVPRMSVNPMGVISGIIFVALFVAVVHGCGASLCKAVAAKSGSPRRWRFRWTLMVLGFVVVTFVSGLSAVGLARHLGWLVSSRQPVYEERLFYREDR